MRRLTWNNRRFNATVHPLPRASRRAARAGLAALAIALLAAAPAAAQTLFQGRIDVTVHDAQGVVPGVTVEIAGPTTQSSSPTIAARRTSSTFRRASTGHATLQGFRPIATTCAVAAGASVPLRITMQVSGVAEAVQVTRMPRSSIPADRP